MSYFDTDEEDDLPELDEDDIAEDCEDDDWCEHDDMG